ncbi:MAG TPA: RagB/SusD family nutrient uptake outer membrane protein, partial [Puia sp.]|nr:RagB/SusD family nutrient uptake outer membrane protein [Puia sp.]
PADDPFADSAWLHAYSVVSSANIILRDIDKLASKDQKAVNRIKGQALAIRGMVHFDLLRLFAPDLQRNSTSPGVPYVKVYDITLKPARNTVKECYDNILADMQQAATLLANVDRDINTDVDKGHIDLMAVNGLLSRINLYAGNWQDAVTAASVVIPAIPLADPGDFGNIWTDASVAEVLWSVNFGTLNDGAPYDNVYFPNSDRNTYRPIDDLVALYDPVNDVRYNAYLASFNGRLIVSKYNGRGSALDGVVNWKACRVGEIYLNRAEANFQLNKQVEALDDLNALRAARINGFTPGTESGAALLTAIRTERRKELAFEGGRFFDLKRWDRTPIVRSVCGGSANSPSNVCTLPSTSRSWAWPIPFNEVIANGNVKQNTGY